MTDDEILRLWSGDTTPNPRPVLGSKKIISFARCIERQSERERDKARALLRRVASEIRYSDPRVAESIDAALGDKP